uniref:Uncharacterized protein n=1 Tax=Rhizophora mucronata TaxID=61149 RepID=A0A2P2P708_RHIMU
MLLVLEGFLELVAILDEKVNKGSGEAGFHHQGASAVVG